MVFEVLWTEHAKRNLGKLQRGLVIRIIKKVEVMRGSPYRFLSKIIGRKEWKLRVGDYRIFIDLDYEMNKLYVLRIDHRRRAYKRA